MSDADRQMNNADFTAVINDEINPLPRSIVRRAPYLLLDGEWNFGFDAEDRGLRERWFIQHDFTSNAPFPGSLESYLAAAKDEAESVGLYQNSDEAIAWYERDFTIPVEWHSRRDQVTQLTFGACGYETRVWLNGFPLKTIEGEEIHFGEYNSFSYEIPPEILRDVNRLTIRVADSLDAEIPRGKQASHVYKQGGIWYQTISGAVRSIWLEPVSRNRLRSRLDVVSSLRDRLVCFDFTMRIHEPGVYHLKIAIEPRSREKSSGQKSVKAQFELMLEAGEHSQRVPVALPDAEFWSPNAPNLYHISAELHDTTTVTGIETNFGLRKIEARGSRVYLNNEPFYLDGILYQPGIATFEEMRRHLLAVKRLGCNLARVHIAGIDPRIFDLADEIGLLLWVEVPSPHSSSQNSRRNHRAELERMLPFITSHPSVVILSLYNEDWGAQDIAVNEETRLYISETFNYLQLNYPQLLFVDNDGWNHVSTKGKLCSHLMTAHVYTPDSAAWVSALERLTAGELNVTAEPLVTGDQYFFRGQIPLIISEWGGFGFTGYGGPREVEEKCERIREFKREMRKRPIAGDVYTQLTSIEEETNGIIDPQSGELIVPADIFNSNSTDKI